MHTHWIKICAEKKLHVLCEKPQTNNLDDALSCEELCARKGVVLAEAFMYRLDPRHEKVRNLIQEGTIGKLKLFESHFSRSIL